MGEIQIANLHNRSVTAMVQQLCDLTAESLVLKEQTPQVTGLFVSNQQKTSIRRLCLGQQHHSEYTDFAHRVFVFRSVDPSPSGGPVVKPMVRHQWMISKLHLFSRHGAQL
jgi:hypothetical protein